MEVVASVGDGSEAVDVGRASCSRTSSLMDYRLPGLDGVQATRALKRGVPGACGRLPDRVGEPARGRRALEAGAVGCLTKDEELDAIVAAIREAARGRA